MAALIINHHYLARVVLAISAMFMSTDNLVLSQGCRGDLQGLVTECAKYVQKQGPRVVEPSQACCDVIKSVDVLCVCSHITKDVEDVLDMDKVVHVLDSCGKPPAHGMKCGNFTAPYPISSERTCSLVLNKGKINCSEDVIGWKAL